VWSDENGLQQFGNHFLRRAGEDSGMATGGDGMATGGGSNAGGTSSCRPGSRSRQGTDNDSSSYCYIIPPSKTINVELDYEDSKKPKKKLILGSMFGYDGAFEHRYRNHSARVCASDESSFLYRIDLRMLQKLKGLSLSASNELFTQRELEFIKNIRKQAPEGSNAPEDTDFSQLQDNTSLASVAEHGKVCLFCMRTNAETHHCFFFVYFQHF
jgi:hypothetical protein